MTEQVAASSPEKPHPGSRRILSILCVTEVTSWGILYYAFLVLSPAITADTGWSTTSIVAAFSIGQLVAAVVGIPVGRLLDRYGPRWVMTAASVVAIPALVVIATSQSLVVFGAGWFIAGVAMAAVLYPPAFAALTRWWGSDRVRALMILTLAAGLASTVFAPVAALLLDRFGWRETYLVLAGVLLVVTVPAHLIGLHGRWPALGHDTVSTNHASVDRTIRTRPFIALTVALSLTAFVAFAGVFNIVPLALEHGADSAFAAVCLGLGGLGQVVGRIGYLPLQRFTETRARTVWVIAAAAITTLVLGIVTSLLALLLIAVGAGLARGLLTLVQATAVTDRWGPAAYGRLNGIVSAPIIVSMACAPWAGAVLADWTGSYSGAYLVLGAIGLLAAAVSAATIPTPDREIAAGTAARFAILRRWLSIPAAETSNATSKRTPKDQW